jgi:hypothetical protein
MSCCLKFQDSSISSDKSINFCPYCGFNQKNPDPLIITYPHKELTRDLVLSEWFMKDGYRGYLSFSTSEFRAFSKVIEDSSEYNKCSLYVHKVDLSRSSRVLLTEDIYSELFSLLATDQSEKNRDIADFLQKNKSSLME